METKSACAKAVLAGDVAALRRMYGEDWFYNLAKMVKRLEKPST